MLEQPRSIIFNEFAVVAKIDGVKRPAFAVTSAADTDGADSATVQADTADFFVANGTLVDFRYVGE